MTSHRKTPSPGRRMTLATKLPMQIALPTLVIMLAVFAFGYWQAVRPCLIR